jgi:hypothetical protein
MANFQYLPGYPVTQVKTETDTSVPPPPPAMEYCETVDAVVKKDADTSFNPVLLDPNIAREQKVKLLEARIKRLRVVEENDRHQLAERDKRVGILTLRRETDRVEIETRKRELDNLQRTNETLQKTNSDLLKKAEESEAKITSLTKELTFQILAQMNNEKVQFLNTVWITPQKRAEYLQANQLSVSYVPTTPVQQCHMMDWMNTNYARHMYQAQFNQDYVPYQWYR